MGVGREERKLPGFVWLMRKEGKGHCKRKGRKLPERKKRVKRKRKKEERVKRSSLFLFFVCVFHLSSKVGKYY